MWETERRNDACDADWGASIDESWSEAGTGVHVRDGAWCEDGRRVVGMDNELQLDQQELPIPGATVTTGGAAAKATIGENGVDVDFSATAIGAELESQNDWSPTSDDDDAVRLGLSASLGFGAGLHATDQDHDGVDEYGFDIGIGPVDLGYSTESPVEDLLTMAALGPLAPGAAMADNFIVEPLQDVFSETLQGVAAPMSPESEAVVRRVAAAQQSEKIRQDALMRHYAMRIMAAANPFADQY